MWFNKELAEQVLELPVVVYTGDQKGYDEFDAWIECKSSLAAFSREFSNNNYYDNRQTIKRLLYITCDFRNYAFQCS